MSSSTRSGGPDVSAAGYGVEPPARRSEAIPGADQLRILRPASAPPPALTTATTAPASAAARRGGRPLLAVRTARVAAVFAMWTALGVLAGLALAVGGPVLLGGQPMIVRSGSMEPLIHTGDLVVMRTIAPAEIAIGDVITFPDPTGSGRLLTHRVRDLTLAGGIARVTTKGDAVTGREVWEVPAGGAVGRVEYRIWKAGYVITWFKSASGLLLIGAAAAVVIAAWVLVGVWRAER